MAFPKIPASKQKIAAPRRKVSISASTQKISAPRKKISASKQKISAPTKQILQINDQDVQGRSPKFSTPSKKIPPQEKYSTTDKVIRGTRTILKLTSILTNDQVGKSDLLEYTHTRRHRRLPVFRI